MGNTPITSPLRVCKENPRYFCGRDGKAVYLTGSHTWNVLKAIGTTDLPGEAVLEWFDPETGKVSGQDSVAGGEKRDLESPVDHDAVLFIKG